MTLAQTRHDTHYCGDGTTTQLETEYCTDAEWWVGRCDECGSCYFEDDGSQTQ